MNDDREGIVQQEGRTASGRGDGHKAEIRYQRGLRSSQARKNQARKIPWETFPMNRMVSSQPLDGLR